jgi:hypothetical protein
LCAVFQPRPTTGYKADIIFANRINTRSSSSQNLLEPKCSLLLAITLEMLALYRNLVKCWKIECGSPTTETNHRL